MTVLDLSVYDLDTLDPECFVANGVTGVILASYPIARMREAARRCRDAGLVIHGFYGFCYFGSPYGELRDIDWAVQLAHEFGVRRVWVDCEKDAIEVPFSDARTATPEQRVDAIWRAVAFIEDAGLSAGIYSGSWWWDPNTGRCTEFAHLPLWNSYYDGDPDIDGLPYGGWTTAAVEQYSSTVPICGRATRDVNRIYEEEDAMTKDEIRAIFKEELAAAERDHLITGSTLPDYVAQLFGAKESTYFLADGTPDPRVNELRDYIQAMAKGGVTAPLIYAKLAEALSAALDVLKKAAVGRES